MRRLHSNQGGIHPHDVVQGFLVDSSGVYDAARNHTGSGTGPVGSKTYGVQVPEGQMWALRLIRVHLENGALTDTDKYNGSALTNGYEIVVKRGSDSILSISGGLVKTVHDLYQFASDAKLVHDHHPDVFIACYRWEGEDELVLQPGDIVELTCTDDMSQLDAHTFVYKATRIPTPNAPPSLG